MSASLKDQRLSHLALVVSLLFILWLTGAARGRNVAAQQQTPWAPQETIPGFHPETIPPVLLADQNRTVYAISSQWIGDASSQPLLAIAYNQWSLDGGWTEPVDVLLPILKQQARILDGFLDESGYIHIAFFSGDDTEANTYYSRAIAAEANRADAWSEPTLVGTRAITPEDGVMAGDNNGNMVIIYSGDLLGRGLYATYSFDKGASWSEPVPVYLAYQLDFTPIFIDIYRGHVGWFHAVWSVHDISNHGQAIYYSQFNLDDMLWSEPLILAETSGGLGTKAPVIIENLDRLVVMYFDSVDGKQHFIQSHDGGQTWTNPAAPFRHVGFNGAGDLIIDSSDVLHYFWGQRISGSPDIHGMWHSMLRGNNWTEPEAVVSGPPVNDEIRNKRFDPSDARAVVSQGNTILVTWRSDPGAKGNGVWYSFANTNAPESQLAAPQEGSLESNSESLTINNTQVDLLTPDNQAVVEEANSILSLPGDQAKVVQSNLISPILVAIIPVLLLSLTLLAWNLRRSR